MGPIILFDKSLLQALSINEAVWFDHFFLHNISPVFFIETLADLEKKVRSGRTPEEEVGHIAKKTPEMSAYPNVLHHRICLANLLENNVTMDGHIIVSGGKPIQDGEKSGYAYELSTEAEALNRWHNGHFMDVERKYAKLWRNMLKTMQLEKVLDRLKKLGILSVNCKTLEDVMSIAKGFVKDLNISLRRMKLVFELLSIPYQYSREIIKNWSRAGRPSLISYSPYSAHVITIDLFFYIATFNDLISIERVTNKIDMAYLYYLPFCHVFTSSDKLHRRCAPLFLRNDQIFIWGPDLKKDLREINNYYNNYPESEKERGIFYLAPTPPFDKDFLISKLWDRYCPGWRSHRKKAFPRKNKKLVDKLVNIIESEGSSLDQEGPNNIDPDIMMVQKKVSRRRGDWWQLPKYIDE